jgi:Holliday junction resolvase
VRERRILKNYMGNRNYIKGVRKERKLVNEARERGMIAFRSAGSHSPIDVVIISKKHKRIWFVQCKPESMSDKAKSKLELEHKELNDEYLCTFEVI